MDINTENIMTDEIQDNCIYEDTYELSEKEKNKMFNLSQLYGSIFYKTDKLKDLVDYINDEDWQRRYYGERYAKLENVEKITDAYVKSNLETINIILNMMIPSLFTDFEEMVQAAVRSALLNEPSRIEALLKEEPYSNYKNDIGFSLHNLFMADSKDDFVNSIISAFAKKMLSKNPQKVLARIQKIVKFDLNTLDGDTIKNLIELEEKRNKIIHENLLEKVHVYDIKRYYTSIVDVLKMFGNALRKQKVYVSDSLHLLDDENVAMNAED